MDKLVKGYTRDVIKSLSFKLYAMKEPAFGSFPFVLARIDAHGLGDHLTVQTWR